MKNEKAGYLCSLLFLWLVFMNRFGELSGGGGAEVPALAIPRGSARKHFHTDAPMGRRCESAFVLLSHKKVTKRLWPAASYGKIGVVGYRLL